MKRFKSLYIVGVAAIVLASSSCKKYLTEDPSTSFSANFVYNTPEGLDMGVVALYNLNRSFYENGEWNFAVPFLLQAKTDLVLGRTGEASLYSTLAWGATLGDFGTTRYSHFWKTYYKIIDRSNAIIKYGAAVQMDESKKNELLAQARFFRAHSYFILYKLFNNIYITTEPTTPQNAANIITDKSSKEDIFKLIEEDLDYARTHLKWEISQPGRVTKGTATHVLAQVALWKQDNQKALDLAKEVIGSVQHALLPSTAEVFKGTLNHKESLFVIQYKAQTFGGGVPHRFNFLLLPQYGATPGAQYDNTMGGRGAGFLLLNDYFRDLLNQDPMDDRAKGSYYISTFYFNNPSTLPPGKKIGDVIDTYDEMSSNVADRNLFYTRLNPGCIKFANETGLPNEVDQSKNIMVYRVAETYLIAAEAAWKLGLDSEGLKYINAIRTRAKAAPITELTLTSILDEDARELGFEGQRWYTLKRLGVMTQQMTKYAGNSRNGLYQANARTLFKNHMVNLPIPQAEINLLGPKYPQNDGY
ncbi:RagB/SusD family nutrient uptake outer membrane protein [Sphingobacterium tabacisoli]|uniref:RagB/SusD family nutrient uptake outer membrane protein n=1 Tax=Sphingobacterium tabacisoli TaxID=2044855 RepID=A0ABW5L2N5_9SPHI|nr:RagB/SusD family nutrient uptake outer membrane protein [Sphingobacterium tabacisoli]